MPMNRDNLEDTLWDRNPSGSKNLMDLCSEAFSLVFHIRSGKDPGHPDDLRKGISLLFRDLDKQAKRCGYSEEDVKATRYALCALIDEIVLNSRWSFRDQWKDEPLQQEYFKDYMAGERFFDLLERVRRKGRSEVNLLEVFCMCLILGFQGKYKLHGGDELADLTRTLVEETNGYRGGSSEMSPHWKIPNEAVERPASTIPRWAWITGIAALLLVILVFVVCKLWLGSIADEASRMIL